MKRLEDLLHQALGAAGEVSQADTATWFTEPQTPDDESDTCPHCGGSGFLRRALPLGHPDFGRAVACECVRHERDEERLARLRRYSNLGALSRQMFDTLSSSGRSQNASDQERYQRAVQTARAFALQPEGWLVLTGESGCGKTHLAAAIANEAIVAGHPALFMIVPDLLDYLRGAYAPTSDLPYEHLFHQVRSAPLLVLDDLGSQSATPWAQEKLFQIINHRFNLQLPTVLTLAEPLETLDARLRSRLTDAGLARVFELETSKRGNDDLPAVLSLPLVREMTFGSFNYRATGPDLPDDVARKLKHAFDIAHDYAQHPEGWLVLLGDTGCGKTHLAAAIAHYQHDAGQPQLFVVVPDLLEELRADVRADRVRDGPESLERVRTSPFLVLDDLGVHSATAWAQEKIFQILNYRYNGKLPTVITIGRPLEELPGAWVSRMWDDKVGMVYEIGAPDYRGLRAIQRPVPRRERRAGR